MAAPPTTPSDPPDSAPVGDAGTPFARRWEWERVLVWVRWFLPLLYLPLIFLFPSVPWLIAALHVLLFGLGNVAVGWLLRAIPSAGGLYRVWVLATAMEWLAAAGVLALFCRSPVSPVPAITLVLIVLTGVRYGMGGVVGGAVGATFLVTVHLGTQVLVLRVLDRSTAPAALAAWGLLILVMALVTGAIVHAGAAWVRTMELARTRELGTVLRVRYRITEREWAVLQLLPREDLATYAQIGAALYIDPETVKTHIHNLGTKLGVSGRWAIVRAATRHGLLPPASDPPSPPPTG